MVSAVGNYSFLDRLVHRIAFSSPGVQLAAADLEKSAFGRRYRDASACRPILVTSLPRAGTTLLLTLLSGAPGIATHRYRDMPFILAPVLWQALSGRFRQHADPRERAHRDGVRIGFDSPEAFEEVLWQVKWPGKYAADRIGLWTAEDVDTEVAGFFREHFQKIVSIRVPESPAAGRYVSKNNASIGRLELIPRLLPDAAIIVPVRKPLDHVASLLRQHLNFRELHLKDPFSRRYMADIGHFEFGLLHRPIGFPGLESLIRGRDPLKMDYWLGYWVAAYEYVLKHRGSVAIVVYEDLCQRGADAIGRVFRQLGIDAGALLEPIAGTIRLPTTSPEADVTVSRSLLSRAEAVYSELAAGAITR